MEYKITDHTADIGIEVRGDSLPDLFRNAALALFDLMVFTDRIETVIKKNVTAAAEDPQALLVAWLSELLYLFDTQALLVREAEIMTLDSNRIEARVRGETFDRAKHRTKREIKAVTYHHLKIEKNNSHFTARIIFDL